jgi:hypothetical protein
VFPQKVRRLSQHKRAILRQLETQGTGGNFVDQDVTLALELLLLFRFFFGFLLVVRLCQGRSRKDQQHQKEQERAHDW